MFEKRDIWSLYYDDTISNIMEEKVQEKNVEKSNEPKKLSELTIHELWAYYEMAQKRFDQAIHYNRMNNTMDMKNTPQGMDFNTKHDMVNRLAAEIDRRLKENIDWRR